MRTCRNCKALMWASTPPGGYCDLKRRTTKTALEHAEYDTRLGKFITLKPIHCKRKIRTIAELVEIQAFYVHDQMD